MVEDDDALDAIAVVVDDSGIPKMVSKTIQTCSLRLLLLLVVAEVAAEVLLALLLLLLLVVVDCKNCRACS